MTAFTMHLQSPSRYECVSGIVSFVGLDGSGSFGILPGHERMMTVLAPGIMRCRCQDGSWQYIGVAGGILYFVDGELFISTRKYLRHTDYDRLAALLSQQMAAESADLAQRRQTIKMMEEALLKQLIRPERSRLR